MTITPHALSVPVFTRGLNALDAILAKAIDFCAEKSIDPAVLCATRLIPDMLPLVRQVQIGCDFAKNGTARIAGLEAPKFEDSETTLVALRERIAKTIAYLTSVEEAAINSAPGRTVAFPIGPNRYQMEAVAYLLHMVTPNFYFHVTTAYDILRNAGVSLGKRDFMGAVAGLTQV